MVGFVRRLIILAADGLFRFEIGVWRYQKELENLYPLPFRSYSTPNSFLAIELPHWLGPLPPTMRPILPMGILEIMLGHKSGIRTPGIFKPHQSPLF
jgi:hypothetical protein